MSERGNERFRRCEREEGEKQQRLRNRRGEPREKTKSSPLLRQTIRRAMVRFGAPATLVPCWWFSFSWTSGTPCDIDDDDDDIMIPSADSAPSPQPFLKLWSSIFAELEWSSLLYKCNVSVAANQSSFYRINLSYKQTTATATQSSYGGGGGALMATTWHERPRAARPTR